MTGNEKIYYDTNYCRSKKNKIQRTRYRRQRSAVYLKLRIGLIHEARLSLCASELYVNTVFGGKKISIVDEFVGGFFYR